MARDWLSAFRPAVYRGVPFKVDIESAAGARRLSVSPIAYSEGNVVEDMGRQPRVHEVTAYVAGEAADADALAFMAALDRSGPGLLVLPMLPPQMARCSQWRLTREKGRAGFVAFDVLFMEAGVNAQAGSDGIGSLGASAADGISIVSGLFG